MKVLMANKYFFKKGGAENSFFETAGLLQKKGHEVAFFSMKHPSNLPSAQSDFFVEEVDYDKPGLKAKWDASTKLLYSFEARSRMDALVRKEKPDLAHLNNIYHQISPSILHALKKHRIPVVLTLRDLKLVCGSYLMLDHGKVCEACKGGRYYQTLLKGCVKGSKLKSLLTTAEMYLHHDILRIYGLVDVFISPSRFHMEKVREMGFKGHIVHLPNFTSLGDGPEPDYAWQERSILYFGRLSEEKGLSTLVEAMRGIPDVKLKIVGDGPLKEALTRSVPPGSDVVFLGHRTGDSLKQEIARSMFIVLPSEVYENNPRTILEGFALGKPAVGSRMGGIPELIVEGETGLTYKAGDSAGLREKIRWLAARPDDIRRMGQNGRRMVVERLNAEIHYSKLMEIYTEAIERARVLK